MVDSLSCSFIIKIMSYSSWTAREVGNRLKELGFGTYSRSFIVNEISGQHLPYITEEHLTEMGISQIGHRMLLLKRISEIVAGKNVQPVSFDLSKSSQPKQTEVPKPTKPSYNEEVSYPEPQESFTRKTIPKSAKSSVRDTYVTQDDDPVPSVMENTIQSRRNTSSNSRQKPVEQTISKPTNDDVYLSSTTSVGSKPSVSSSDQKEMVTCEYCGRKFNQEAAQRHIPVCARIRGKSSK